MTNIWYKLCMSVSIGSYNGFAPVWCQAISSTNSITSDGQKTFIDSMIQMQIQILSVPECGGYYDREN